MLREESKLTLTGRIFRLLLPALMLAAACNQPSTPSSVSQFDDDSATLAETSCYRAVVGQDTFYLTTVVRGNEVSGLLDYLYHRSDDLLGDLTGTLENGVMIADYYYTGINEERVKQVAFRKTGDGFIEGSGEQVSANGKMVFKDPGSIRFTDGVEYLKIDCR